MNEQWKDVYFIENGIVYDYRGLYMVSSHGRVKSLKKNQMKQLNKNKGGYLYVPLYKGTKQKNFLIHRLVAFMFIENSDVENKVQINHIDEDKENNHISNLEWVTPKENVNHGTRTKRTTKTLKTKYRKIMGRSLTETKVIVLRSAKQGIKFGFCQQSISACCRGKQETHKGYVWNYVD